MSLTIAPATAGSLADPYVDTAALDQPEDPANLPDATTGADITQEPLLLARGQGVSNIPPSSEYINTRQYVGVRGRPELGQVLLFNRPGVGGDHYYAQAGDGRGGYRMYSLNAVSFTDAVAESRNLLRNGGFTYPIGGSNGSTSSGTGALSNQPAAASMINLHRAVGVPGRPELGEVHLYHEVGAQGDRYFAKALNGMHPLRARNLDDAVTEARNLLKNGGFAHAIHPVPPGATQFRAIDPNAPPPIRYKADGLFNTNLRARAEAAGFLVEADGTIVGQNSFAGGVKFGELFTIPGLFRNGEVPPLPANATPEFELGLKKATEPLVFQSLLDLAVAGSAVRLARGSVSPSRAVELNRQFEQTPARALERIAGPQSGMAVGWQGRGEAPLPWNRATQANNTTFDCNWCTLEAITGQPREQLRRFSDVGVGETMSYQELGAALKKLNILGGRPEAVRIEGARDNVVTRMEQYQPGQYFAVTAYEARYPVRDNNDGQTGHTVLARRTANGIEILDGQLNQTYDAARLRGESWYAYPITRPINPELH